MKIAVIHGGYSPESKASTENAAAIAAALKKAGHKPALVEFTESLIFRINNGFDMAFIATQGKFHGDGTCQAVCDLFGIPYTGARAAAAAVINDKALCKIICNHNDIPTPSFLELSVQALKKKTQAEWVDEITHQVGFPAVAKPTTQGGSFGISYLEGPECWDAAREACLIDDNILIEKHIAGTFATVSVIEKAGQLIALPVLTAEAEKAGALQLFIENFCIKPACFDEHLEKKIVDMSLSLFRIFKARGYARIDFMVDENTGIPYFLEINAVPGMRPKSFFPHGAKLAGYEMPEICRIIVEDEGSRYEQQ